MAIGEVLTALRPEFPDITISKIRFLDGAGLVQPERSGSGYRRFAESDLHRLRQVLVLQRDHYLPLRVIRDHITAGTLEGVLAEARPPGAAPAEQAEPPGRARADNAEDPEREVLGRAPLPERVPLLDGVPLAERAPLPDRALLPERGDIRVRAEVARRGEQSGPSVRPVTGHPVAAAATLAPAAPAHPSSARPAVAPTPREPTGSPNARAFAGPPRRLRVEDLLRASGLSIETVTELETAGLLRSRNGWYYPEDLVVALAAAQLALHGIGPRHLRSLRNGADRELGLLEQSLAPVLRRARPDARVRAEDTARTLRELYSQVHTALVTAGLRDLGVDPR